MVVSGESPIDRSVLGAASRRLLEAVAEFLPELLPHARAPSHYHEYADDEGVAGVIDWARANFDDEVVISHSGGD